MKYFGFFFSLIFALCIALGLAINLASLPPLANVFDPFRGFWQNAKGENESDYSNLILGNLKGEVEVFYDHHLIPHIYAADEEDLYRVQGYITARHRLWQMEFQVLAAGGRLSEIVGDLALDYDREMRRKGMTYGAEQKLKFLRENDPETLRFIQAYSDGVNAYIEQMTQANLPVEYKLLDYQPEPWSPYKTLLFLMNMAEMLSGDRDLQYTNFWSLFGEEWLEGLFLDREAGVDPVISKQEWDFTPLPIKTPDVSYPDSGLVSEVLPSKEPGLGSNNWAVSGSKTQNGYPILANDPHLALNLPSLWFVIQLSTDEFTVKGASLPGALGVILGYNENIAWGSTNADRDVKDWYAIKFKDENRQEYLYNDQWIQSTKRIETIKVNNQEDFIDTVIYTHYGPVVYDKEFNLEGKPRNFALKWTAHEGSNEQKTFLDLNKSSNHSEYLSALSHYTAPAQNFVFASVQGDIAMKVQGKFPIKWEEQGKFLMDGNNPKFEWQGYIPGEHNAHEMNPARGFVSSANQLPTHESYPYYVFGDELEHYRNRRINERLSVMQDITIEDMMELQQDNFHLHAAEMLPVMIAALDSNALGPNGQLMLQELKDWDLISGPDQSAPALFASWWNHLEKRLGQYWDTKGFPVVQPGRYHLSQSIVNNPEAPWFDNHGTPAIETAADLIRESFLQMVDEMVEFKSSNDPPTWAAYKNTHIAHLVPAFGAYGHEFIRTGGGKGIVNAIDDDWGPGWRMVVELGPEIKAFGIFPGGQSGNPGSQYYDNFIEKWASGEYIDIGIKKKEDLKDRLFHMYFSPN